MAFFIFFFIERHILFLSKRKAISYLEPQLLEADFTLPRNCNLEPGTSQGAWKFLPVPQTILWFMRKKVAPLRLGRACQAECRGTLAGTGALPKASEAYRQAARCT